MKGELEDPERRKKRFDVSSTGIQILVMENNVFDNLKIVIEIPENRRRRGRKSFIMVTKGTGTSKLKQPVKGLKDAYFSKLRQ